MTERMSGDARLGVSFDDMVEAAAEARAESSPASSAHRPTRGRVRVNVVISAGDAPSESFVYSNVLIEGLFAPWSATRALLVLARAGVIRLLLSPTSRESRGTLLKRFGEDEREGSRIIDDYAWRSNSCGPNGWRALQRRVRGAPRFVGTQRCAGAVTAMKRSLIASDGEHRDFRRRWRAGRICES